MIISKKKYNFPRFQKVQHFPGGRGVQLFQGGGVQVVISIEFI